MFSLILTKNLIDKILIDKTTRPTVLVDFGDFSVGDSEVSSGFGLK